MKITANHIKTGVLHYLRFEKQFVSATEVQLRQWLADVMGYRGSEIIEVEVKVDKYDLLSELNHKIEKHRRINESISCSGSYPISKFYFAVPEELVETAREVVAELNPRYGILLYTPPGIKQNPMAYRVMQKTISCVRPGKKLQTATPLQTKEAIKDINKRLSSEVCNLSSKVYMLKK